MFSEIFVFILLAHFACVAYSIQEEIVTLDHGGQVKGYLTTSATANAVREFLGIPYTKPPVGDLRFKAPEPIEPWKGAKDATSLPNACVQTPDSFFGEYYEGSKIWNPNTNLSEDCLTLNIWAPKTTGKLLPVMVWIYGGSFYSGSASLSVYDGKILATSQKVIVVAMNYRVNLYGFLYFGIPEAPGNVGLLDQNLALRWVKQNIQAFGGNPKLVTVFGESAGAVSVDLQLLSPLSKGLFVNAIMESGSATAIWGTIERDESIKRSLELSKLVNCWDGKGTPDKVKIVKCLRGKSSKELIDNQWIATDFIPMTFRPVVDGYFLPEDPEKMLAAGKGNAVNAIYGTNHEEGNYFFVYYLTKIYNKNTIFYTNTFLYNNDYFEIAAKKILPDKFQNSSVGLKAIFHEYGSFHPPVTAEERQYNLDKMAGDFQISCPTLKSAMFKAMAGMNVYVYYMVHRSSTMPWPKWMGVLHGYEIQYVFGEPLNPIKGYNEAEKTLSNSVMNYFGNFAKTGNPNEPGIDKWPKYTPESQQYLIWNTGKLVTGNGLRYRQCQFWDKDLPELIKAAGLLRHGKLIILKTWLFSER